MKRAGRISAAWLLACAGSVATAQTSQITCIPAAVPALVRAEGLSEKVGDILLNCSGPANAAVNTNLTVFLTAKITNRVSEAGTADAVLTVDNGSGSGAVAIGAPSTIGGANSVNFFNANFSLGASGQATLRISNLRAAIGEPNLTAPRPVQAYISVSGPTSLAIASGSITVASASPALMAGYSATSVPCSGSPLPSEINLENLFSAGTQVFSVRATEGFSSAFQKRGPMEDSGTRILLRYTGFPATARLFVPDAVAGSNALQPTAGGDLGTARSAGQYAPGGSGSLLLVRVIGAGPNGAGGAPVSAPAAAVMFNAASEVPLVNGSGFAVYEVVDSDPSSRENAQIPTFLGMPRPSDGSTTVANEQISLAPVSNVDDASSTEPVPRFMISAPGADCGANGDCGLFPQLGIQAPETLTYSAQAGSGKQVQYVRVRNEGSGLLSWTATVTYKTGSGWVEVFPTAAVSRGTIQVFVSPEKLAAGKYEAALIVDAGPFAGSRTLPITLTVTAPPTPPAPVVPTPAIESATHAATLAPGPLVPGSLATLKGSNLAGKNVSVTFDGLPATQIYNSAGQINLLVPAELGSRATAQLVVTVDGVSNAPMPVALATIAPGIFANGVLNQDSSVNSAANPAPAGSVIQIFATGLPLPGAGTVTARIQDRQIDTPYYGGPAPGLPGVQQVNLLVPADLETMTADVMVCGASAANPAQKVCSPPFQIAVRR